MARRHVHTDTSAEALANLDPKVIKNQCDRIENYIRAMGSATILEMEHALHIVSSTISARLAALREQGRVHESVIKRKCKVNKMNKKQWVLVEDSGQLTLGRTA